ncbi:hypothetical protein KR044_004526, partial [Drosophila immigrans]
ALQFKFTNVFCASHNETRVQIYECRLKAINRNLTIFNFNATIFYPVYDMTLNMQLFKKANGYKPFLVKTVVDICQFHKKNNNPYYKILFRLIKDFTNFNHSCPYGGPLIFKGLQINPAKIGLPAPTGDYLLGMKWSYEKKLHITSNIYFTYTENVI